MTYIELSMGDVKGDLGNLRDFLRSEEACAKNDEDELKEGEYSKFNLSIRLSAADDAFAARVELWYYDEDCEPHFLAHGEIEPKAIKFAGETLMQYHAVTDEIALDVWDRKTESGA